MAVVPAAKKITANIEALKDKDLKSVEIPWSVVFAAGANALQPLAGFKASRTYVLVSMRQSFITNGGAGWKGAVQIKVGFSARPSDYTTNNVAAGLLLSSVYGAAGGPSEIYNGQEFMNWTPYGWYLPVGKQITVLVGGFVHPTAVSLQQGTVQLFLYETFEQNG